MKRFIVLNSEGIVVAIRFGDTIVENELESSQGEIGQKLVDEKFVDVPVDPSIPQKSLSEQIDDLKLRQELTEEAISFLLGL